MDGGVAASCVVERCVRLAASHEKLSAALMGPLNWTWTGVVSRGVSMRPGAEAHLGTVSNGCDQVVLVQASSVLDPIEVPTDLKLLNSRLPRAR